MVMTAEEINQLAAHIFTSVRGTDGRSLEDNFLYNSSTIRIRREEGDTSERLLYMDYFGTTHRHEDQVS